MTTLYEKRGRRYVPVHDTAACDGLGNGDWLISVRDGMRSCRRLVEPDHAAFLAAARVAGDAMLRAIREASEARPRSRKLTRREQKALAAWREIMGEETMWLEHKSAHDIIEAGIEAVRRAWEEMDKY